MIRTDAARKTVSRKFASRPVRVAVAVKIALAILGANVSFAAAKAYLAKPEAPAPIVAASVSTVKPFILQVDAASETQSNAAGNCHEVVVETDEGYGVRGTVTRTVCRAAL